MSIVCADCGRVVWSIGDEAVGGRFRERRNLTTHESYYETHDGRTICQHCYEENYCRCEDCDEIFHNDDMCYEDGPDRTVCCSCDDSYETCDCCSDRHNRNHMYETESHDWVCQDCYENEYYTCCECDSVIHVDDAEHSEDDSVYCQSCYDDLFTRCIECGSEITRGEARHTPNGDMCERCVQRMEYVCCIECGEWVDPEDTYELAGGSHICNNCIQSMGIAMGLTLTMDEIIVRREEMESERRRTERDRLKTQRPPTDILNYHCNTERVFLWQDGEEKERAFFGIELEVEVEENQTRHDQARRTLTGLNKSADGEEARNHWTAMNDGSLNDGFELISQPMTARYFDEEVAPVLEKEMADMVACGVRSHDTSTCGLHFHVSKCALTPDTMVNMTIAVDKFQDVVIKISRRKEEKLNRWAAITAKVCRYKRTDKKDWKKTYDDDKQGLRNIDRYSALNFTNASTVEFRACRGTLKYDSFIGCFHFFRFLIDWCAKKTFEQILDDVSEEQFIADMAEYSPELKAYAIDRGLVEQD